MQVDHGRHGIHYHGRERHGGPRARRTVADSDLRRTFHRQCRFRADRQCGCSCDGPAFHGTPDFWAGCFPSAALLEIGDGGAGAGRLRFSPRTAITATPLPLRPLRHTAATAATAPDHRWLLDHAGSIAGTHSLRGGRRESHTSTKWRGQWRYGVVRDGKHGAVDADTTVASRQRPHVA